MMLQEEIAEIEALIKAGFVTKRNTLLWSCIF